ncbi:MAG: ABC transporter ATP-binding protein, partial [Ruminococcus sp.]|nr:ABC transporter ATP-binding protein [Ruminococcus sp.]
MARNKYDVDEQLETPFDFNHLKRSFVYVRKHRKKMLIALCLSILAAIAGLIGPLITSHALDVTIPNQDITGLVLLSLMLLGFNLIATILGNIRSRIMTRVGQDSIFDIREDLFAHLQKLPFSYYDDRPHGKILI